MEWGAAATALFTVVLAVFKWWQSNQPKRDKEAEYEAIQQGRADIANDDYDAVNARIDRLLSQQGNHVAGQPGREVTAERISAILRLADSGRSTGEDSGASGSVPKSK